MAADQCVNYIEERLQNVQPDDSPHIIVHGPKRGGKTCLVKQWLCALHETKNLSNIKNLVYLSSVNVESYGVGFIRHILAKILKRPLKDATRRMVVLDDAQGLTNEAQNALVRMIELYAHNNRFVFVTDNYDGMSAALKSRCISIPVPLNSSVLDDSPPSLLANFESTLGAYVTSASVENGSRFIDACHHFYEYYCLVEQDAAKLYEMTCLLARAELLVLERQPIPEKCIESLKLALQNVK